MTFRSLTIEYHSTRESAQAAYSSSGNYEPLQSLNAYTFPKPLEAFAKERGLEIFYVDNAWIRVAMDGGLLKQFMSFGQSTEVDLVAALDRIHDDGWYVVQEEEF